MIVVDVPPNSMPRINKLFAYLSVDENGNEGLCAGPFNGMTLPLIAADAARLSGLSDMAEMLAKVSGRKIVLVEFTTRKDLATF